MTTQHPVNSDSIQFPDGRSMATTILFPALGFSFLFGVFASNLTGVQSIGWVVFATSAIGWLYLRARIIYAIRAKKDALEIDVTHKTFAFLSKEITAFSIHAFPLNKSLLLVIRVAGKSLPQVFFTGALSTSVGEFKESVQFVQQLLPAKARAA